MSKAIPKTDDMKKVESMLSATDKQFMSEYGVPRVCIEIDKEMFFLNKLHSVPATATLVRHTEGELTGQVIGMPAIIGG